MSANNFSACLAFTLREEGGFVDNPSDPGGATNHGITLTTYQSWFPGATLPMLEMISDKTVSLIYHKDYWLPVRGDELPAGLDLMTFDMGVNAGPRVAITLLQHALGVVEDGDIGPITLAVAQANNHFALARMHVAQVSYYQQLNGYTEFGRGWEARALARYQAAVTMRPSP